MKTCRRLHGRLADPGAQTSASAPVSVSTVKLESTAGAEAMRPKVQAVSESSGPHAWVARRRLRSQTWGEPE